MKLTVCGSFGFGNVGDEAIPQAIQDMAEMRRTPVIVDVLSRFDRPEITSVIGLGEQDKQRRESLQGQPIMMSGGGIIEPRDYATLFRCKRFLQSEFTPHASLFCVSVDAGLKYGFRNTWRIRHATRNIDKIYVRDVLSEQVLRGILPGKPIETIGDMALWLAPSTNVPTDNQNLPNHYIAVSLSGCWKDDPAWYNWISGELCTLAREHEADIVFIPMSCHASDDDREEHRHIRDHMFQRAPDINAILLEDPLMPKVVAHLFAEASLVVTMRLHGCVMAYAQQTPFVGISYHPKLYGFVDTVGWGDALIPLIRPKHQSDGMYGYKFDALNIEQGMLVSAASRAVLHGDFSRLEDYKRRISEVFDEFLHMAFT